MFFDSDVTECGNMARWTADGGEERIKEDNNEPWRRPETVCLGEDVKQLGIKGRRMVSDMLHKGQYSNSCLVRA